MRALFGENVSKNERFGSCLGGGAARQQRHPLDPPVEQDYFISMFIFSDI